MPLIFLCYRRSDTEGVAGRLYDRLLDHYTDDDVFRDIDDIRPGENFVASSERALAGAKAFVALIGRNWLDAAGKEGERRLMKPSDRVRIEIEMALRLEVPVLPVLVGGAEMPGSEDLPDSIAQFALFNALPLDSRSFDYHVGEILKFLEPLTSPAEQGTPPEFDGGTPSAFEQPAPQPQFQQSPALAQLLPGMWQIQIQYPNGFTGQAGAQFFPNGTFVVQGTGMQAFEIQGMWQVDASGALMLSGQQTDGFQVMPYQSVIQFQQVTPQYLNGAASTGERGVWTKVG